MKHLGHRVKRLEARRTRKGACRVCGGEPGLRCVFDGDPDPAPCPGCGRLGYVVRFELVGAGEGRRP